MNHRRSPVTLKKRTIDEVVRPAEMVSSILNLRAIATAAIACFCISPRDTAYSYAKEDPKTFRTYFHGLNR